MIGALVFGSAPALAAPEVPETGAASSVTAVSASVSGILNPHVPGELGVYYFAYAPRGATCNEYAASGELPTPGFQKEAVGPVELTGLEPSTLYTYCLTDRSLETEETTYGSAKTFTTLPAPPVIEGESTSSVNSTAATLEGQVNPNNQVTSCVIEYGMTNAYGTSAPCEPASLEGYGNQRAALTLTGLTPGTTYHFRIVAENASKEKKEGAGTTFTTVPTPNTDAVSAIAARTATFHGHLTLDPVDTTYSFDYKIGTECTGENTTTTEDAGSGPGTPAPVSAPVTGLKPATQYAACLVTSNAYGAQHGSPVTFTTLATSPSVDSESSENSSTKILLDAHITPNGGETTYQFEYGETQSYGTTVPIPAGNIGAGNESVAVSAVELTGAKTETVYHYRVVATNLYGTTDGPDQTLLTPPLMGPLPVPGATGLPDGRVYEEVTPAFKNGNFVDFASELSFGQASADGNAALYLMSGAVGNSYAGTVSEYVSRRTPGLGWLTSSATPRPQGPVSISVAPTSIVPSADFNRFVFTASAPYVTGDPRTEVGTSPNIFLTEDPAVEPMWLSRPLISNPIPGLGELKIVKNYYVTGATPDLSTVYFTYAGTLLPEDSTRAPYVGEGQGEPHYPWGFYEWSGGTLREAGTLPDGKLSPFGAVPAAVGRTGEFQASGFDNEVSEDGRRAFFVSPDPQSSPPLCGEPTPPQCTSEPPELYMRETKPDGSHVARLVSMSQLPGHEGQPAPHGPVDVANAAVPASGQTGSTSAFASPDGSHVFFASVDQLTQAAPQDGAIKEYDFDLEDGVLMYLPDVSGPIVAVARNGSDFIFKGTTLDLWTGPGVGHVSTIAQLPGAVPNLAPEGAQQLNVNDARVSSDGSVFLFRTNAQIPGGFNNGNGFEQIYRYDVSSKELDCVSCPPVPVAPSGDTHISYDSAEDGKPNGGNSVPLTTIETRGMLTEGVRVFFDTPDPLVSRDTNGKSDVYEWEYGKIYLISSGASAEGSFFLDSSESGGDVFFATSEGLVSGDADGAYDVYDARIPRPGDNPPPPAVPCKGSVCQGPPSVPALLGAPASETFSGAGNLTPTPQSNVKTKTSSHPSRHKPHKRKRKKAKHANRKTARGSVGHRTGKSNGRGK